MRGRVSRQQRATGYCMSLHREVTDGLLRPPSEDESEAPPSAPSSRISVGRGGGSLTFTGLARQTLALQLYPSCQLKIGTSPWMV